MSWLSGLLYAEIFSQHRWMGGPDATLTSENSPFLLSGPQEATLVMWWVGAWWELLIAYMGEARGRSRKFWNGEACDQEHRAPTLWRVECPAYKSESRQKNI